MCLFLFFPSSVVAAPGGQMEGQKPNCPHGRCPPLTLSPLGHNWDAQLTLSASSQWWPNPYLPIINLLGLPAPCKPCLCHLSATWDSRLQGEAFVMGLELPAPLGSPSQAPSTCIGGAVILLHTNARACMCTQAGQLVWPRWPRYAFGGHRLRCTPYPGLS